MKYQLIAVSIVCGFLSVSTVRAQDVLDLGQINVLAMRGNIALSDISQAVSIIDEDDIRRSTATSLPELIGSQSGIFVSNYLGNPKGVLVDVRGLGETSASNMLVLVDGRRTNQVDLSGVDWGQISLDAIKRIEILKGSSTVLYGDNACAGVINIVTKRGYQKGQGSVKIETESGSYKYKKGSVSAGGTTKALDYFFSFSHQESSGYRVNNDYWANDFLGNASFTATDKVSVDLSTGYHRDRYGMPGALFASDIATVGRRGSTHDQDRGWTSDVFVNFEPKVDLDLWGTQTELSLFNSFRERYNKSLSVSSWGRYETAHHINSFEIRPKLDIQSDLSESIAQHAVVGLDYFYAKDKVRSGNQGSAEDFVDITKQTVGFYGLERFEVNEKYLLSFGGRAVWADYDFDQTQAVSNREKKKITDGAMNCGIGYKYNKNSQVYFDYARAFRLPATDEYYQNKYTGFWGSGGGLNTDLKHQISHNYEIGIRDASLPWLTADMNAFLMDVKNEIYYDPITYKNSNYNPTTRHLGFELEGKAHVFRKMLEPFVNWTWQDAFLKGGKFAGNKVPFIPKNKISAGVSVNLLDNLQTTFSMNYIGKCFAISDQANDQAKLDSYVTFDFRLDYRIKDLKMWFGVKNMFDRQYSAYGVYSSSSNAVGFYPAAERNYLAGISYAF
ncbi:MAG TPA: TonB-dependent receptor [Candidatus Omnitrophota bacterium]|nr:TonB-dependent receptor [Candidatus Omnitrophota bacterium]